jgi:predicted dehydrogenase
MKQSTPMTRRRFLCGAGAAVSLPLFLPQSVLAKPGPNERIGIGYIGVGRRGRQLMRLPPDGRIVALCDVYAPQAQKLAHKLGCRAYTEYRKMLEASDIDAVIITTPDHWHALHSIHACQAGKDVYCEKPLSLTIREGRLMVEAARKHRRVFQTGSQQRSMAPNRTACELVRNGRFGKIKEVIAHNYPSPWECGLPEQPTPEGLNWDAWCGPTPYRPFHADIFKSRANPGWISFRPYSGGEMTGWGSHGLDQVQWALGTDETGPVEVWTEGPPFPRVVYTKPESRQRGNQLCSQPLVRFRYGNGILVRLENGPPGGAIFIGDKGKITIDRNRFRCDPPELAEEPLEVGGVRLYVSNNHMQNWFDCIKSRKKPVADVEIGHRSATLCHLANIARWLGRKLKWDPEKELFVGDDEANTYLDRPRRKPYQLPESV